VGLERAALLLGESRRAVFRPDLFQEPVPSHDAADGAIETVAAGQSL